MTRPQPPAPSSPPLILASSSPRRRELLAEAGYKFTVMPPRPDIECGVCSESGPAGLVAELAFRKAASVVRSLSQEDRGRSRGRPGSRAEVVVAADTVAECDGFVLGKPEDEQHARAMLRQLSGRQHRVLTGICLFDGTQTRTAAETTDVEFIELTDQEIDAYVAGGEPLDKAGAYGIQGGASKFIKRIDGCYFNVVGLPLATIYSFIRSILR